jgi:trypsin-like peptidase
MKLARKFALFSSILISCSAGLLAAIAADDAPANASLSSAICPIIYRLDESPSGRGYHYAFFGNAFFINNHGDLLTVAHVLETFRNGGQPSILANCPNRPPQLLPLSIVAADAQHDVAIVRATPNPFSDHYRVAFLPLAPDPAFPGESVLALSLHPARLRNALSFQAPVEDRSAGTVLSFEQTQLDKSAPATEVFLLSHPVTLGQSGSPVLAANSRAVVGLVEGRWVRDGSVPVARASNGSTEPPGAAIPVRYAITLLKQNGIAYRISHPPTTNADPPARH